MKQAPAVVPPTYYRIQAKFAPDVFFPSNALEERFWERSGYENVRFTTLDDKNCIPQFISTTIGMENTIVTLTIFVNGCSACRS